VARVFFLTGHRGAAAIEPENTLPSFYRALLCGATAVEFDVRTTLDGVAVVVHDEDLSRLTGTSVRVSQITYAELSKLRVYGRAKVPTLREVLALAKGRLSVDVELKAPGAEREVVEALRELEMVDDAIVTSFFPPLLESVKKLEPSIEVGVLTVGWDDECLDVAEKVGASFILPHYEALKREIVDKIRKRGYRVITWTVNDARVAELLVEMGVEGVITDNPCELKSLLKLVPSQGSFCNEADAYRG